MSDASLAPSIPTYAPSISLRELWPWVVLAASLFVVLLYFVGSFQGSAFIHEFVHDGRHLLGFPCH